jgi:hypothetical protein
MMNIKKFTQKDRHGNMFSFEFYNADVPEMEAIPAIAMTDHPGEPRGSDTVPAWLTPGEFVINAEATEKYEPLLKEINDEGRAIQAQQGGSIPIYQSQGGAMPAANIDGNEFVKAAQAVGLSTDKSTLNKIVDLVNQGMSVTEAAKAVASKPVYAASGQKITKRVMPNGKIGLWRGNTYLGTKHEDEGMLESIAKQIGFGKGWSLFDDAEYKADGGMTLPMPKPQMPDMPALEPQQLYEMLKDRGFTDTAARGIMGNFYAESKLDPDARQLNDGPGRGLAQWERGGRFDTDPLNLSDFSMEKGTSWRDPTTQLDFMVAEMDRSKKFGAVRDAMNKAKSPAEAANIFLKGYEKANPEHETYQASVKERGEYATKFEPEEPGFLDNITDMLRGLFSSEDTQYKAPGGMIEPERTEGMSDQEYFDMLKKHAQDQTANNKFTGYYSGDEALDEGSDTFNAARSRAEMDEMQRLVAEGKAMDAAEAAKAGDFEVPSMFAGDDEDESSVPAITDVPPEVPTIRSINKMGKTDNYQKKDGEWFRVKADGTLASSPATGLIKANLNNQESPITETVSRPVPKYTGELTDAELYPDAPPPTDAEAKARMAEAQAKLKLGATIKGPGDVVTSIEDLAKVKEKDLETATGTLINTVDSTDPALIAVAADKVEEAQNNLGEVQQTAAASQADGLARSAQLAQRKKTELDTRIAAMREQVTTLRERGLNVAADKLEGKANALDAESAAANEQIGELQAESAAKQAEADAIKAAGTGASTNTTAAKETKKESLTKEIVAAGAKKDGPGSDQPGATVSAKAVEDSGNKATPEQKQTAMSFMEGVFGDLFDKKELARMAVMYVGSRLMGYSHEGSLGWAAKNYLKRVDASTAAAEKFAIDNVGKFTTKSLEGYKKNKDLTTLVPLGKPVNPTGTKEMWYSPEGKRVQAEKYKVGDAYIWSADGGKTAIPSAWHQDAARVPNTDKYNDRIKSETPILKDVIQELQEVTGDKAVSGSDKLGTKKTSYKTAIRPAAAAQEVAMWAAKNGMDVASASTYARTAYEMAVAAANEDTKPSSLIPYLNQLKIRQDTGIDELFNATVKDKVVPMDSGKIEGLSTMFLRRAGREGAVSDGTNRDAVNQFWTQAAAIWAQKVQENPAIVDEYKDQALPGETAFYVYARTQLQK